LAGFLAAGLGAASVWAATNDVKPTNYLAAAEEIRAGMKPGDVILVPEAEAFWGLAWYLIGPDWGSPLSVQDASPGNSSEQWTKILERMGPVWRARLHLEPRTRGLSADGALFLVGLSIPPILANTKRVWLVNEGNNRHAYVELP